jgi:hypothetical protein
MVVGSGGTDADQVGTEVPTLRVDALGRLRVDLPTDAY